jgi:hypothetical protein
MNVGARTSGNGGSIEGESRPIAVHFNFYKSQKKGCCFLVPFAIPPFSFAFYVRAAFAIEISSSAPGPE